MESSVAVASYPTPPHTNRKSLFPWARLVPPPPLPPAVRVPSTSHTRGNGKLMTRNYSVRAEGMGAPSIRNTDLAGASRAKVKGRKSNSRGCGASAVAQDRPVSRICRFPTLWFRGVHAIRRSSGAGRVLASLVTRARGPGVLANGSYASGFRRVTARVRGPQVPIARFCDGFGEVVLVWSGVCGLCFGAGSEYMAPTLSACRSGLRWNRRRHRDGTRAPTEITRPPQGHTSAVEINNV